MSEPERNPVILLTGQPGVGKTTLIQKLAEKAGGRGGGFYTQEMRERGQRKGFEIVTFDGQRTYLAKKARERCFAREMPFKSYRVNLGGIEELAVPSLLKARDEGKLIFVDEVGPMEISSPVFCDAIWELLEDQEASMIGTIVRRTYRFADEVKRHPRVRPIEVTLSNRNRLVEDLYERYL